MENLSYFDLHCDTLTCIKDGQDLRVGTDQLSLEKAAIYKRYSQVFAIFSSPSLSGEESRKLFRTAIGRCRTELVTSVGFTPYLSVENATMLEGRLDRVDALAGCGVRLIAPVWKGENELGGAHDTDIGLTDFGTAVTDRMLDLGIVPDVSHASERSFYMIAERAALHGKPIIASHSDSYSVCRHSRNLRDAQFSKIVRCGGIVGINLCPFHLSPDADPNIDTIIDHIDRYMSLGGEHTVCFGCDLDGIESLPRGINSIASIAQIADRMTKRGYSDAQIRAIFFDNAINFFEKNRILPLSDAECRAAGEFI